MEGAVVYDVAGWAGRSAGCGPTGKSAGRLGQRWVPCWQVGVEGRRKGSAEQIAVGLGAYKGAPRWAYVRPVSMRWAHWTDGVFGTCALLNEAGHCHCEEACASSCPQHARL